MKVTFNPLAEKELVEGARYYAEHANKALGDAFISEVLRAAELLARNPAMGTPQKASIRAMPIRRFPYSIFYHVRESELWIVAVAHHRRRPGFWSGRT